MALKITLKPGEKFVINGAVIVNGDRRTNMVIQNKVSILRERDIMQPDQADTPVKRIYFPIMMLYLEGGSDKALQADFLQRITEFINVVSNAEALQHCVNIIQAVNAGEYYRALLTCKRLLPFEQERLSYDAGKV
jgi:flagellar protein FlbT